MTPAPDPTTKSTAGTVSYWFFSAALTVLIWKLSPHGSYSALVTFICLLGIDFVSRRVDRHRLARLTGLFDNGTVIAQSAGRRTGTSAVGSFHGRHAEISVGRLGFPYIRILLPGDFGVEFQARPKRFNTTRTLRSMYWIALLGLGAYASARWKNKLPAIMWTLAGAYLAQFLPVSRRRFGATSFYKRSKVPVSFPGSEFLEFSSVTPETFGGMIERPEIQGAVSRLIRSHQVELLCVAYRFRGGTSAPTMEGNTIEVNYSYRRKWLEPEHLQAMLLDLLVLCNALEAAR